MLIFIVRHVIYIKCIKLFDLRPFNYNKQQKRSNNKASFPNGAIVDWLFYIVPPLSLEIRKSMLTLMHRYSKKEMFIFNHALNTIYLRLYGVRHMVKDHSDSDRGNPLPPHGLLFPISCKGSLYASSHRQDNTYHGLCYTSRGSLAGTTNSSLGPQ